MVVVVVVVVVMVVVDAPQTNTHVVTQKVNILFTVLFGHTVVYQQFVHVILITLPCAAPPRPAPPRSPEGGGRRAAEGRRSV